MLNQLELNVRIPPPPDNPSLYYFAWWVEYSTYSAAGGSGKTLSEAIDSLLYHVNYYLGLNYPIREAYIEQRCARCDNRGVITVVTGKRTRRHKEIKCPLCNGNPQQWSDHSYHPDERIIDHA